MWHPILPVPSRPAYLIYKNLSAHQVTRHKPQATLGIFSRLVTMKLHVECCWFLLSEPWEYVAQWLSFAVENMAEEQHLSALPLSVFQENRYFLKPAPVSEIWIWSVCAPGSCSTLEGCYSKVTSTWHCARWDLYLWLFGRGSQAELV